MMATPEVLDAEIVPEQEATDRQALVPAQPVPAPTLAVAPQVEAKELVARLAAIKEAMETAMVVDVDYGVIPGTNKPALLKPGAEKLAVLFQFDVQTTHDASWEPGQHLTVTAHTTVFHIPTGARVGSGEGLCTTRERKYAYRKQERLCPACGTAAVIKGKEEYGGGWLCWKKRDGCGAKFDDGDQAIEGQEVGQTDNPDLPDSWNTIIKMARKRALIDAILLTTGASALFTQDIEADSSGGGEEAPKDANGDAQPPKAERTTAPRTTAQPAQRSERAATANQKTAINGRCGKAGLGVAQQQAILQWTCATAILDRVSFANASALLDALDKDGSGAGQVLEDIGLAAEGGDERARKIAERYLKVAADA